MPDQPTDPPPSGPRRILPVPGLLDLDAVEDANFAEAFGEDKDDASGYPDDPAAPPPAATSEPAPMPGAAEPPAVEPPTVLVPPASAAPEEPPAAEARAVDLAAAAVHLEPPAPPPLDTPVSSALDGPSAPLVAEPAPPSGYPDDPTAPPPTAPTAEPPVMEPPAPASSTSQPAASEPLPEDGDPEVVEAPDDPAVVLAPEPTEPPGDTPEPAAPSALPVLLPPRGVVDSAKEATRSRGRELVQLVLRYGRAHVPPAVPRDAAPDTGPPRMVGRVGQLIPFLRVIPWVLAALFAVSFWWDFDGQAVVLFGRTFAVEGLLKVLTVSGLIGFGTNWLAITMLFQPREKRAIIPQGLIPAQRERVIYRLSEAISRELINADIIKQKIQESGVIGRYRDLALGVVRGVVEDPGFRADLKALAEGYAHEVLGSEAVRREVASLAVQKVEEQAGQGLGGMALRLYRTFAEDDFQRRVDRALDELPSAVAPLLDRIDTALDAVPAKVEARADEIEEAATRAVLSFVEGFDIRAMIQEKARGFDEAQLESLLKSTSNEQLNYIKYLGAVLGVFGGFIIWQPIGALVLFATIGLALWGLDEALVRARR